MNKARFEYWNQKILFGAMALVIVPWIYALFTESYTPFVWCCLAALAINLTHSLWMGRYFRQLEKEREAAWKAEQEQRKQEMLKRLIP